MSVVGVNRKCLERATTSDFDPERKCVFLNALLAGTVLIRKTWGADEEAPVHCLCRKYGNGMAACDERPAKYGESAFF